MEKKAIIEEGVTPPENETLKQANQKYDSEYLESHLTKRAADKVEANLNTNG